MTETERYYLRDLVVLIVEYARDVKRQADQSNDAFDMGRAMAYYEVVGLIQQQLQVFGMDGRSIGMPDINPDQELL